MSDLHAVMLVEDRGDILRVTIDTDVTVSRRKNHRNCPSQPQGMIDLHLCM